MKIYTIEFYSIINTNPPYGCEIVDNNATEANLRQIMANWYVNIETQFFQNIEELDQEDADWLLQGVFIVRDKYCDIIDRVASDTVRLSPEIETADPEWFEKNSPTASVSESSGDEHDGPLDLDLARSVFTD